MVDIESRHQTTAWIAAQEVRVKIGSYCNTCQSLDFCQLLSSVKTGLEQAPKLSLDTVYHHLSNNKGFQKCPEFSHAMILLLENMPDPKNNTTH